MSLVGFAFVCVLHDAKTCSERERKRERETAREGERCKTTVEIANMPPSRQCLRARIHIVLNDGDVVDAIGYLVIYVCG